MGKKHDEETGPAEGGSGYEPQPEVEQPGQGANTGYNEKPEIAKPETTEVPELPPDYNGEPRH
ncbi:hypothetical protein [Mucilaginibacter glaciei]|uniref:Uncharacterized protein n=1 Tax=Mucilaginibacter glaciei TaxID=2772109 RepID=A0A926S6C0_9SPHI|nr:hypothetical protein [Mucilaginibacter glaciei]MBD1393581.1 hypothetical protein [Mucilaginibacter glaciei]